MSAGDLAEVAAAVEAQLVPHLALEERTIVPALRALPDAERQRLRAAIRERRSGA